MYTYACIEEESIGRTLSHTDSKDGSHSHSCNDEDRAFEYQLDQLGVEDFFHKSDEATTREFKLYIEEWEISNIKKKSQVSKAMFPEKYYSLALYDEDMKKIFIIDHEILEFNKTDGWNLI